jgi:hypothetical protein
MSPSPATRAAEPSAYIRFRTVHDRVVVLDLRAGRYLVLEAAASRIWNLLIATMDRDAIVRTLTSEFDVTPEQARTDLDQFTEDCERRGLLSRTPLDSTQFCPAAKPLAPRQPTTFHALRILRAVRRELTKSGFAHVYEGNARIGKPRDRDPRRLASALRAFSIAENFVPSADARIDCLPRSLALHRFLVTAGVAADHCIGVRRFPFGAHAWVEVGNVVVCDADAFVQKFDVIARL